AVKTPSCGGGNREDQQCVATAFVLEIGNALHPERLAATHRMRIGVGHEDDTSVPSSRDMPAQGLVEATQHVTSAVSRSHRGGGKDDEPAGGERPSFEAPDL